MKALTTYQPWASLMMAGAKPFEFRKWAVPRSIVGHRIVNHASAKQLPPAEIEDLLEMATDRDRADEWAKTGLRKDLAVPVLERALDRVLPVGAGLGTMIVGEAIPAHLIAELGDSKRIDHHVMAWPMTELDPFREPIFAKGKQGFWTWNPGADMVDF